MLDGVMRFVVGRYGRSSGAGAMFAFEKSRAVNDRNLILIELSHNLYKFRCFDIKKISQILPQIAAFDSIHDRDTPHVTPFQLAHLFVRLP
jgi:hypothetical protein